MGIFNVTLQASFAVGFAFLGPLVVAVAGPSFVLVLVTLFYAAATVTTLFLPPAPPIARDPGAGRGHSGNRSTSCVRASPRSPGIARSAARYPSRRRGLARRRDRSPRAGPRAIDRTRSREPHRCRPATGAGGGGGGVRPASPWRRRPASAGGRGRSDRLRLPRAGDRVRQRVRRRRRGSSGHPARRGPGVRCRAAYATTLVSAQTALFESMPAGVRGRVFGVLASIVSAASLIPILVAGPLADAISGTAVIAIAAVGVLIVAGWSATLFGPRAAAG